MNKSRKNIFNSDEIYKPKTKYYKKQTYYSSLFPIKSTSPLKNELEIFDENFEQNIQDDTYMKKKSFKINEQYNIPRSESPINVFHSVSPIQLNNIDIFKQEIGIIIELYYITYEFKNYNYILFEKRPNNSMIIYKIDFFNELNQIVFHDDSMVSILNVNTNELKYFNNLYEFYDFTLSTIYV